MKKILLTLMILTTVTFAQAKKDSTTIEQLIKEIGKYELFDSAKDIDEKVKELIELRQKRLNELVQSDVVYNKYDTIINVLSAIKKEYENKKILQLKEPKKN